MDVELLSIEGLDQHVGRLAACQVPSEVFRALLEGARLAAPRTAVFLVRRGQVKGWGCVGYHTEAVKRQREFSVPVDSGWFGELAGGAQTGLVVREDAGADPDFGQQPPAEAVALAIRVKGRAIALLLAERQRGEAPWYPNVLNLLVTVGQLRLDLDLARRKLAAGAGRSAPVTSPDEPTTTTTPPAESPPTEPQPTAAVAAVEPIDEAAPQVGIDEKQLDAARRYAKLVATDIRLYNEEAVVLGRREGDLAQRLAEHLRRGKETFIKRHGSLGPVAMDILREAYVDVLAGGDAELLPATVLD
jgi:hypothetical protein